VDLRCRLAAVAVMVTAALGVALAEPARSQAAGERIHRYDVSLTVTDGGELVVEEVIDYDFGPNERHGILRRIPTRVRYDDTHDRRYPLTVDTVEATGGAPAQHATETERGTTTIRIGDPDRTVTGRHTYSLAYRVGAALNGFPGHDELYWNAVGADWDVPVDRAAARVTVPGDILRVACFAGPTGSNLPCAESAEAGRTATFSSGSLPPGQALTVVVGFPTGVVPRPEPVLEERWTVARAFAATPVTLSSAAVLLGAMAAGVAWLGWRTGRDRRAVGAPTDVAFAGAGGGAGAGDEGGEEQAVPLRDPHEVPVEFVPPDDLRPGLVGTLIDETAHPLDVSATIVDLAVRGYLRIEEVPDPGWFASGDWRLLRLRPAGDLLPYERVLLDGLFRDGDAVLLSSLRNTFAARLARVRDALYDDVVDRGWFVARPDRVRSRWLAVGLAATVLAVGLVVLAAATTRLGLVPVPLVLGGLLLVVGSRWMPRRTAKGTGTLRRVRGFRRFIDESEADRARFAERANLFSEYLPYAVVFGATDRWARTFADLDGRLPETGWYVSHRPFTAVAFADTMGSFAVTSSGTMTSTPSGSGSSGFGGGGSAGGGGGGGGGGSW
jgi:uncharacterized protein (TIGR04222 family)